MQGLISKKSKHEVEIPKFLIVSFKDSTELVYLLKVK